MRSIQCTRLRPRVVIATAATLLLLVWMLVRVDHQYHPGRFIFDGPELAVVPFEDFYWLDRMAGDYFTLRPRPVSSLPPIVLSPGPCRKETFMAAFVTSPPKEFSTREAIRSTWAGALKAQRWPGSDMDVSVEVFFVLGTTPEASVASAVLEEAKTHGDVVLADFVDSYDNLTLKSLTGLRWLRDNCRNARFIAKVDSDTLVDFPRLTRFLADQQDVLGNAVIGKLYFRSERWKTGKWRVDPAEYPLPYYPTFAGGPCYVLSMDAVVKVVEAARFMPAFRMEDVQVTGILAKATGVRRLFMQQLRNWNKGDSLCAFLQRPTYQVSITELNSSQLRHAWKTISLGTCLPYSSEAS